MFPRGLCFSECSEAPVPAQSKSQRQQAEAFGAGPLALMLTTKGELECSALVHPMQPQESLRRDSAGRPQALPALRPAATAPAEEQEENGEGEEEEEEEENGGGEEEEEESVETEGEEGAETEEDGEEDGEVKVRIDASPIATLTRSSCAPQEELAACVKSARGHACCLPVPFAEVRRHAVGERGDWRCMLPEIRLALRCQMSALRSTDLRPRSYIARYTQFGEPQRQAAVLSPFAIKTRARVVRGDTSCVHRETAAAFQHPLRRI